MNKKQKALIALMTDFGVNHYSGIMKGQILKINPFANIITITDHIQYFNIREGAYVLLKSYKYFPPKTIFLVVIDPGVGGFRKAIGAESENYYFIGPDNGILSPILFKNKEAKVVDLPIPSDVSQTFHGRDVFAPAAGKLSLTYNLEELGPPTTIQIPLNFLWDPTTSTGEVIFIDHFGNIITNLPKSLDLKYDKEYMLITPRTKIKMSFKRSYFEGSDDNPFLVVDSFETLEIALRNNRAADMLDITPGDRVQIQPI